jgi:hypothetical protein
VSNADKTDTTSGGARKRVNPYERHVEQGIIYYQSESSSSDSEELSRLKRSRKTSSQVKEPHGPVFMSSNGVVYKTAPKFKVGDYAIIPLDPPGRARDVAKIRDVTCHQDKWWCIAMPLNIKAAFILPESELSKVLNNIGDSVTAKWGEVDVKGTVVGIHVRGESWQKIVYEVRWDNSTKLIELPAKSEPSF